MAANFFGDRWTYLQVNGYLWVVCGLVARAIIIEQHGRDNEIETSDPEGTRDGEDLSAELAPGV
jgi:hypothetical protein